VSSGQPEPATPPIGSPTRAASEAAVPSLRRIAAGTTVLTIATAAHKVGLFVMKARLGHLGGAAALGGATGVLTVAWMIAALSHLGIPDHAMVRAAVADEETTHLARARHGLFLLTALGAGLVACVLTVPRAAEPAMAALLVLGAVAQHAAGLAIQTLRGRGRPRLEAISLAAGATAMIVGALVATSPLGVAASYALQGTTFVVSLGIAAIAEPSLRPAWPDLGALRGELTKSLPMFVVGVTALVVGNTDILGAQLVLGDEAVGSLSCATMVVRTGLAVPWLLGTLLVSRVHHADPGPARLAAGLAGTSALLALGGGLAAYLSGGLVSEALGVPLEGFEDALVLAIGLSFASHLAILCLPLAMALALRGAVRATLAALAITGLCTFGLASSAGLAGAQIGHAIGHLSLGLGLLAALALRPRGERDARGNER
jgi:hypothetical protein